MVAFYKNTLQKKISQNINRKSSKELKEFAIFELVKFAFALRLQKTEKA